MMTVECRFHRLKVISNMAAVSGRHIAFRKILREKISLSLDITFFLAPKGAQEVTM